MTTNPLASLFHQLWNAYRRVIDRALVWPILRKQFSQSPAGLSMAERAFRIHIGLDPAYDDLSYWQIEEVVQRFRQYFTGTA